MERRFICVYDGPREKMLEAEIKELLSQHGWVFYVVGEDHTENEFDLTFFKEDTDVG